MLSIIICSISSENALRTSRNIDATIGNVEHEIIVIDNKTENRPIAKAYNHGAAQAKYPYLFFVHEDVLFHSCDWGGVIEDKLKEKDCGVIGFSGSKVKLKCYSGWMTDWNWTCGLLFQGKEDGRSKLETNNTFIGQDFNEVVALDGLGMFVRKDVWQEYPFDEGLLTGFHCYDVDFSLQIAHSGKYRNYSCTSLKIIIEHLSSGKYNSDWFRETIKMHDLKWNAFLPMAVEGYMPQRKELDKKEELYCHKFAKDAIRSGGPEKKAAIRSLLSFRPLSWKHFGHCIEDLFRYLFS